MGFNVNWKWTEGYDEICVFKAHVILLKLDLY